jgi:hypothetical protein
VEARGTLRAGVGLLGRGGAGWSIGSAGKGLLGLVGWGLVGSVGAGLLGIAGTGLAGGAGDGETFRGTLRGGAGGLAGGSGVASLVYRSCQVLRAATLLSALGSIGEP